MTPPLSSREKRDLKARAQRLDATLHLGRGGISEAFLKSLDDALSLHGLVKVRFSDFKDQKKVLAPEIAEKSQSHLIMRVGNVAVFYRPNPRTNDFAPPTANPLHLAETVA